MARLKDPQQIIDLVRQGDRGALARALSLVEQGGQPARDIGRLAYPFGGHSYTVGLTGAPGAGKSTLTSALIGNLRERGETVSVSYTHLTLPTILRV